MLVKSNCLDCACEVFYCEELIIASDDGDSDGIDVGIKQIGAVAGGVHPEIMDNDRGGGLSYVFSDEAKVRASIGSAGCKLWFAVELVGYLLMFCHLMSVDFGGFGEDRIEVKWRKSLIGAVFVRGGEEILLGHGEVSSGVEALS